MGKPKLSVTEVWILLEVIPYEGSSILGVFTSADAAKDARPRRWRAVNDGGWTTRPERGGQTFETFYAIEQWEVRGK